MVKSWLLVLSGAMRNLRSVHCSGQVHPSVLWRWSERPGFTRSPLLGGRLAYAEKAGPGVAPVSSEAEWRRRRRAAG